MKKVYESQVVGSAENAEQFMSLEVESEEESRNNQGGLGLNAGYTVVTSTYKRYKAGRKRKFDEWWNGNHRS